MENLPGIFSLIVVVIGTVVNLITIVKIFVTLERRLTKIETMQEEVFKSKISKLENMLETVLERSKHVRQFDPKQYKP